MTRFALTAALVVLATAAHAEMEWAPYRETSVIEIVTEDAGGAPRETKVWVIVQDDAAFVRTNDSQWLANIRRGSPVRLRVDGAETKVRASEVDDDATKARVEAAFLTKYGFVQRVMSALRISDPTVLRLVPAG